MRTTKNNQGLALSAALAAAIIVVSGGLYIYEKVTSPGVARHQQSAAVQKIPSESVPSPNDDSNGSCPTGIVGSMLGVEIFHGHAPTANGGSGAGILSVDPKGLGAKAGVKAGDVVVACNGTQTTCPRELMEALQNADPSQPTTFTIERNGKRMEIVIPAVKNDDNNNETDSLTA